MVFTCEYYNLNMVKKKQSIVFSNIESQAEVVFEFESEYELENNDSRVQGVCIDLVKSERKVVFKVLEELEKSVNSQLSA